VTFAAPLALLGLVSVPVLLLLDRLRRRPRRLLWPSLLLWRAAGVSVPAERRGIDPLLLLECACAVLLTLAAAGPAFAFGRTARSVVALIDTGPHTAARRDGTTVAEASRAEWARLRAALDVGDEVREFTESEAIAAAAAGLPDADLRVVVSDRPGVEGPGLLAIGRAATGRNVGIDAVFVRGDRLWFALATDGAAREARVRIGGEERRVPVGEGVEVPFAERIEVLDEDNYDGDDVAELRRAELRVRYAGDSPYARAALFAAGFPAREGEPADLVIETSGGEPLAGDVRGAECTLAPGIFEGLVLEDCVWRGARARAGEGLLAYEGRALASWLDARTLWLGLPLHREWDSHGTLALLLERIKRARAEAMGGGGALAGDAWCVPPPGFVVTRGVDRPWDGKLPEARRRVRGRVALRAAFALLAVAGLAVYARAIVRGR
jgi:hypothetical protein